MSRDQNAGHNNRKTDNSFFVSVCVCVRECVFIIIVFMLCQFSNWQLLC